MKAAFYTLGCKVNQNESGAMEQMFRDAGYEVVAPDKAADIYIVNSCTVTAGGDAKSRQWLRRARRQNPAAVTVLTGCFPQAFPAESQIPEADIITGTRARAHVLRHVEEFLQDGKRIIDIQAHQKGDTFEELPVRSHTDRTRAFIKVQDGCNRRCAYCIIPTARGPARSRGEADILAELGELGQKGFKEVVFTGINLPSYGRDTGTDLAQLLDKAAGVEGIERLRLSSLDPDLITESLIARFAASKKLCRHFHLSLQSGSTAVLRRMRRPYTAEEYAGATRALLAAMPDASFTTDIIVGFPGETEPEFHETLEFVKSIGFLKVHVFPFSPRPGTPAANYPGQVPKAEKQARAARLGALANEVRAAWIATRLGSTQQLLLEAPLANGMYTAYTESYIPVHIHAPGHGNGDIVAARLQSYNGEYCEAFLV